MRVLLIALALIFACGAAALAADQTTSCGSSASPCASVANPSGQAMVDACLARCLNASQKQVSDLRAQGWADPDIAMACAIAAKSSKPLSDVAAKYQSCKDWSQVAGGCNLSMSDLVSAPVSASADCEAFNTAFFAQYYSMPQSQIAQLRRQGCSWDDVNVCANAALRTNQPITQIATMRQQGSSWSAIAAKYSVDSKSITTPVTVRTVSTYSSGTQTMPTTTYPAAVGTGTTGSSCCPPPQTCPPAAVAPPPPAPPVCPSVCAAGPTSCCGNGPCNVCDGEGNIILTYDQVMRLYADGNDWLDVAIAVNITRWTGYPIRQVLSDLKSLGTWQQNIIYYGVPSNIAFNVADFPFARRSIYSVGEDAKHMQLICKYQKPGTWPTCSRGNPPCPGGVGAPITVVPVPCPNPCGTGPVCPSTPTVPCPCPATPSPCQ